MEVKEMHDLLQQVQYGHLGCMGEGHPYVVPMHYYFSNSDFYIFTTEGMKTQYMDANPAICFQVEEIHNLSQWRSVVILGRAERLTEPQDIEQAMELVKAHNPTLSPAISRTWIDTWGRANVAVVYRVHISEMTGRITEGFNQV
jgi:hypothetical protein